MTPKLSADARVTAFPWSAVPRLSRRDAHVQSALARWVAVTEPPTPRLRALLRLDASAPVRITIGAASVAFDPHAASCTLRQGDVSIVALGASSGVRALAQRMLGGPEELAAPRPLGAVEQALWSLVVATAVEDLGVRGQVWPSVTPVSSSASGSAPGSASGSGSGSASGSTASSVVPLDVVLGDVALHVQLHIPAALALRSPALSFDEAAAPPGASGEGTKTWLDRTRLELPLVVGRCALHRDDLRRLAVRSVITLERPAGGTALDLEVFGGVVGLSGRAGTLAAEVATGYVRRDMALPDDAHVELTVGLGTTQLSLRQITELAVGQIIQLGRPLAGPFELRASGRVLGRGELVDVDGELAVRIVSLGG